MQLLISIFIVLSRLAVWSSLWLLVFFFSQLILIFSWKWLDLIKARKLSNILRFNDDLNTSSDSEEFERNYCNIYPEKSQLYKENTDKHKASLLDLDIKIRKGKFQVSHFDKKDPFPFPIVIVPDTSSNVPYSIVLLQLVLNH